MIYRFYRSVRNIHTLVAISKTKIMNLEKCYFRYIQNEEKVDITFLLKIKEIPRQFNFSRKPTEKVDSLLARIGANIKKYTMKGSKKKNVSDSEVEVKLYDDKNNEISKESTCLDLFSLPGPLKLNIHNQVYEAVFNSPWVVNVQLPQCILAGFPVYPEHFVVHYADKQKSSYIWYKGLTVNDKGNDVNQHHIKWELVWNGFVYTPTSKDIGMKLKLECTPGSETMIGPTVEVISKNVVEAGPGTCPFEVRHKFTMSKLEDQSFRCVTYNILADLYCDSDFTRSVLHPYCPPYALHIDYRKQLIIKELIGYNADIICLQEVDTKIFNHCLSPLLESDGMEGQFYRKGKEVAEGLACFYRSKRFGKTLESHVCLKHVNVASTSGSQDDMKHIRFF